MQTSHRIEPRTLLLWGNSTNHCTTVSGQAQWLFDCAAACVKTLFLDELWAFGCMFMCFWVVTADLQKALTWYVECPFLCCEPTEMCLMSDGVYVLWQDEDALLYSEDFFTWMTLPGAFRRCYYDMILGHNFSLFNCLRCFTAPSPSSLLLYSLWEISESILKDCKRIDRGNTQHSNFAMGQ